MSHCGRVNSARSLITFYLLVSRDATVTTLPIRHDAINNGEGRDSLVFHETDRFRNQAKRVDFDLRLTDRTVRSQYVRWQSTNISFSASQLPHFCSHDRRMPIDFHFFVHSATNCNRVIVKNSRLQETTDDRSFLM